MHIFHNWHDLYTEQPGIFLGEKYTELRYANLRFCPICNKIQKRYIKTKVWWATLEGERKQIALKQIKNGTLRTKNGSVPTQKSQNAV
jgi:hypothetical protein